MAYEEIDAPAHLMECALKMGLRHPIEALLCAPDRYEDYRHVVDSFNQIEASANQVPILARVRVRSDEQGKPSIRGYGRRDGPVPVGGYADRDKLLAKDPFAFRVFRLEIDVEDSHGQAAIISAFGAVGQWKDTPAGQDLIIRGTFERAYGRRQFRDVSVLAPGQVGLIAPIYLGAGGKGVNMHAVAEMVRWACSTDALLEEAMFAACEQVRQDCAGLPDAEILRLCMPEECDLKPQSLPELLASMHRPNSSVSEGLDAIKIASRICALGMQCRAQRQNARPVCPEAPLGTAEELRARAVELIETVENRRGYALTRNQTQVILGVAERLASSRPLNGLLSGEVGAGKTIAYSVPAAVAHLAGARVCIFAPTTLLADQIAKGIASEYQGTVPVELVKAGGKIRNPDAILVGTTGLNSVAAKQGYQPDFVIFDEQHKLHTAAREALVQPYTHVLEVSATPIPRSLALSLYDGMDLFTLNEQPVKKEIHTALIDVKHRGVAAHALKRAIEKGARCAVVFTLVDPQEGTPAAGAGGDDDRSKGTSQEAEERARRTAIDSAADLERFFPGQVALLHGKMKPEAKGAALDAFRAGAKNLMVTTTIFETGIDVPDIQVLVIRDPEHLGQSQLHQLRGRLARSGGFGLCFLLTEDVNALSPESYARLSQFSNTLDGYALARADMLARGAGDLEGLQQTGRASTTFKGIKLSIQDLLMDESCRPELVVEASLSDEGAGRKDKRQTQSTLFA